MDLSLNITAPVTVVVAPYKEIPNLPAGHIEARRYVKDGATIIEAWPASVKPPHTATVPV